MSEQILTLVVNVDDSLQKETADKIRRFLIDNDIIKDEKSDNILGGDSLGYKHGDNLAKFSDEDPDDYGLYSLVTNGVSFIEERRAFHDYSDIIAYKCPSCAAETVVEIDEDLKPFWRKVHQYDKGTVATLTCSKCGAEHPIDQYDYMGQLAFGNIGIEFYNWPPISDTCKSEMERLINSKVTVVWSHL